MKSWRSLLIGLGLAVADTILPLLNDKSVDLSDWKTLLRAAIIAGLGYLIARYREPSARR